MHIAQQPSDGSQQPAAQDKDGYFTGGVEPTQNL